MPLVPLTNPKSLTEIVGLVRQVPAPLRDLIVKVVHTILTAPDKQKAARKALEAARTKALDEALKAELDGAGDEVKLPSPREALATAPPPPRQPPPPKPTSAKR